MIRICYLLAVAAFVTSCGSESFTEVESVRSPLIAGFESYASREEVRPKLPPGAETQVSEDSSLGQNDSRPPYRIYTLNLAPFKHLEHAGKLVLTFYNDRLEQTAFYPENFDSYVTALKQSGVGVMYGRELVAGDTVIWIGLDFDNKHYIGWADNRLRTQRRRWLARYS